MASGFRTKRASEPVRGHRPGRALWLLAIPAIALALVLWASLERVREGERAFRSSVSSVFASRAARLGPGRHLVLPLVQRVVRVPEGAISASSSVKVRSREGIDLEIPFEVEGRMDDAALAVWLGGAGRGAEPGGAIESAASRTLAEWGDGKTTEALVLLEGEAEVEGKLQRHLEEKGWGSVALRVGRVRGGGEAVAAISARALRERVVDTKVKIAILGLDGADWEIIEPLLAKGELPNLARLRARGAWGNMKTMVPALSPLLWTSVATGKPPEQHGIVDFLVKDPGTGKLVPVSSRSRKVKALWNIFSDAGRSSAFVAWWATWPSEQVAGYMVSDRVAYSLFGFVSNEPGLAGATYPEEYFRDIRPKLVDAGSITLEEVRRFAKVAPAEFAASRDRAIQDPGTAYRDPISHLRKILASERSYQAIALDILSRGQPDLFAVYYQGIDEVCHRFAHDMPPKMDMVTPEDYARYRDTVFAYYRFQDRQLGEVLGRLSPDTVVLVLSDHGFQNGSGRPKKDPPNVEGKPGLWHRRYGIFIAAGPGIRPGRLDTIDLLDVAPTVLYLAGLPAAADMQGRVLREAIAPAFLARVPARTLPSYENIGRPLEQGRPGVAPNGMDDEAIAKLRSLGYVGGGPEGAPPGEAAEGGQAAVASAGEGEALVTAHLNEAGVYLKKADYVRARAEVKEALKMKPDLVAALLLLVNIEEGMKNFDGAGELARQIIAMQPDEDRRIYDELGWIYIHGGRVREGITYYERLASERPQVPEIRAALGLLLLKDGQREAAEKELLEALRLDPALPEPLTELHTMYRDTPRILTLEPMVRKGLAINDRSIVHLNLMGIIYERKRDLLRAESAFKEALELDPDYAATMANLGALYGRSGRLQEAVAILGRAVGKDPDNVESWMNLGAAQGKLGRTREAIESLETARRKGVRTTMLYNALAIAYLQDHQVDRAVRYLKESLALDPDQKDASELLKAVSRPS